MIKTARLLLDVFTPRACLVCGTQPAPAICIACLNELEPLCGKGCRRCGNPQVHREAPACPWCSRLRVRPVHMLGVYAYRHLGRAIYQRVKYDGYWRLLDPLLQRALPDLWQGPLLRDCVSIVPIPPAPSRRLRRLFNPPTEIAHWLAQRTGRPVCHALRTRFGQRPQVGLPLTQRRRNAVAKFTLRHTPASPVLLVDDVMTTGATLEAASRCLTAAGVREVRWLTLFRRL